MIKSYKVLGDRWLIIGFRRHSIALGFQIDKYGIGIDLLFFWVGFEW